MTREPCLACAIGFKGMGSVRPTVTVRTEVVSEADRTISAEATVVCGFCGGLPDVLPETNARFEAEFRADLQQLLLEQLAVDGPQVPYTDNGQAQMIAAVEASGQVVPGTVRIDIGEPAELHPPKEDDE